MATERLAVSGSVLRWARTTSGYDEVSAAKRLAVAPSTLTKWEEDVQPPTLKQLRNAAHHYGRPLGLFFLDSPPVDAAPPLTDFRTAAARTTAPWSPALLAEVRRAVRQQDLARELAQSAPDALDFGRGDFSLQTTDVEAAGASLRALLGLDDLNPAIWTRRYEALNAVVSAVEQQGALVLHTANVSVDEVSGFSVAELPFPVVGLNGSDWPSRRLFTLLHECVHLALRDGGACDLHEVAGDARGPDATERLCNRIAASALMPEARVRELFERKGLDPRTPDLEELRTIGHSFGVSSEALLIRLIHLELTDWASWHELKPAIDLAYRRAREEAKTTAAERPGGPDFYTVHARNLGHAFVTSVLNAFADRAISSFDLVHYLGVRYDQVPSLQRAARR